MLHKVFQLETVSIKKTFLHPNVIAFAQAIKSIAYHAWGVVQAMNRPTNRKFKLDNFTLCHPHSYFTVALPYLTFDHGRSYLAGREFFKPVEV